MGKVLEDHRAVFMLTLACNEESAMFLEIVSFERPDEFSNADLLADAQSTIPRWQGYPGLVRKQFVTDGPQVKGIYLWTTREAATQAHDAAWITAFSERTGVRPRIEIFDLFMVIDNEKGAIETHLFD